MSSGALSSNPLDAELGHQIFEKLWVSAPSSTTGSDGLGPLFNARSCEACHANAGRGSTLTNKGESSAARTVRVAAPPNPSQSMQMRTGRLKSVSDPNLGSQIQTRSVQGLSPEVSLQFDSKPVSVDGRDLSIVLPRYSNMEHSAPEINSVRLAPSLFGLAALSRISDLDILNRADPEDLNRDGISGRPNMIRTDNELHLGRFGWKASHADLTTQTAEAFSIDLGLSTTLYPYAYGDCQPSQTDCIRLPNGNGPGPEEPEVSDTLLRLVSAYLEALPLPSSVAVNPLFESIGCADCHTPEFKTVNNGQAEIIRPYTDVLLHDLGNELADPLQEYQATGGEWRTAPLWGLTSRYYGGGTTGYLHDGRAETLIDAIAWHGGEAKASRALFFSLPPEAQSNVIQFLEQL